MENLVERTSSFMGSAGSYQEADTVLVGAPMDFTVSFRPGSRLGPNQVRAVSHVLEEYSPHQDKDLADYAYYDLGDVALPIGNVEASLEKIGEVAARLLNDDKFPLFIGGEHLISWPVIRETAQKYPNLAVLHFDAHADLRSDYLGQSLSHATVMRKVAELLGPKNLFQFGIRSGTREEFAYARENTNFHPFEVLNGLYEVAMSGLLEGRPVYITFDIDVVDPAYAPATGTPEPGGITSGQALEIFTMLKGLQVVGFDLVEVAPSVVPGEQTAILAAKMIREAILCFCPQR